MVNIVQSPPARLVFAYDDINNKFIKCPVSEMESGKLYFLVEPRKNTISAGTFQSMDAKTYQREHTALPIKGNSLLYLFVKSHTYASIKDDRLTWQSSPALTSLSTSSDYDFGVSHFDEKPLDKENCPFPLLHSTSIITKQQQTQFFSDIHHELEDMALYSYLQSLYSNAKSVDALEKWKSFKKLYEAYTKTWDPMLRCQLIYRVAKAQNPQMDEVDIRRDLLKEQLLSYRQRREKNPNEYYTVWASMFGGSNLSRTAKLNAVDIMVDDISHNQFDFDNVPLAAQNGELHQLLENFKAFEKTSNTLAL
ncbi:hypothetical protein [Legionella sp. W05-934-2]|jgi:hypothetical protein|uniref:hypothetical protein n=1 Tax=Legionella sp. W05-934-2 TaxID=1198649 RepID=UPI003462BC9D